MTSTSLANNPSCPCFAPSPVIIKLCSWILLELLLELRCDDESLKWQLICRVFCETLSYSDVNDSYRANLFPNSKISQSTDFKFIDMTKFNTLIYAQICLKCKSNSVLLRINLKLHMNTIQCGTLNNFKADAWKLNKHQKINWTANKLTNQTKCKIHSHFLNLKKQ